MVELADTPDLGSGAARHTGSSPAIRIDLVQTPKAGLHIYNVVPGDTGHDPGALAQLGAHNTGSVGVRGSNPLCSIRKRDIARCPFSVWSINKGLRGIRTERSPNKELKDISKKGVETSRWLVLARRGPFKQNEPEKGRGAVLRGRIPCI